MENAIDNVLNHINQELYACTEHECDRFILKDDRYKDLLPAYYALAKIFISKLWLKNDIQRLNDFLDHWVKKTDTYLSNAGYSFIQPKALRDYAKCILQYHYDLMDYVKTLSNDGSIVIPQIYHDKKDIVEQMMTYPPPRPFTTHELNQLIEKFVNTPLPDDNDLLEDWEIDLYKIINYMFWSTSVDNNEKQKHVIGELLRACMNKVKIIRSKFYRQIPLLLLDLLLAPEENGKYADLSPFREEIIIGMKRLKEEEKK
jgi:hypothetical protein